MAVGNPGFFVPRVMACIQDPKTKHRYLYLNSIKEIVNNDSKALEKDVNNVTEQLLKLANHKEAQIRILVAECIGGLFSEYPIDMGTDLEGALMDNSNPVTQATVARSFMFSGRNITHDAFDSFESCAQQLIGLIGSKYVDVKRFALEGLNTMIKNNTEVVKGSLNDLIKACFAEFVINKAFIQEIQLPDNSVQKIDDGVPMRTAAYNCVMGLIDQGVVGGNVIIDLIDFIADGTKGFAETHDDMWKLVNGVLAQLWRRYSAIAHGKADKVVAVMEPKFDFFVKNLANEVIMNKMLAMLKTIHWMNECQEN